MPKMRLYSVMYDGGDGGGRTYLFVSDEDREKFMVERNGEGYDPDDEYENGYKDETSIEYEIVDGKLVLPSGDAAWSFHWGQ